MSDIALQIERLIVVGLPLGTGDSRPLRAAVEAELGRLLGSGGVAPALRRGAALPRLSVPGIQLQAGLGPAPLGERIAGAVYRGIGS